MERIRVVYLSNTPQVSMVYWLVEHSNNSLLVINEFFEYFSNILIGLSAYKP